MEDDYEGRYPEGPSTFSLLTLKNESVLQDDLVFLTVAGYLPEHLSKGVHLYSVLYGQYGGETAITARAGSTMYDIFQHFITEQFLLISDAAIYDSKGNQVTSATNLLLTCDEAALAAGFGSIYASDCDTLIATSDFEEPKVTLQYEDAEDPANLWTGNWSGLKYSFYRKPAGTVIRHSNLVQTGSTPQEVLDHFIRVMKQLVVGWDYDRKNGTYGINSGVHYRIEGDQYRLFYNYAHGQEDSNTFLNGLAYFGGEKMATAVWSMFYEYYQLSSARDVVVSDLLAAKYGLTLDVLENDRDAHLVDISNGESTWRVRYLTARSGYYALEQNVFIYIPTDAGGETSTPSGKPAPVPDGYGPIKLTRDFGMGDTTVTLSAAKESQAVLTVDGVQKTVRLITVARESAYDNEMIYRHMTRNADGSYSLQSLQAYMGNEKRSVEDLFADSQGQPVDYVYLPYADVYLAPYSK
jgi:hypothetical protein